MKIKFLIVFLSGVFLSTQFANAQSGLFSGDVQINAQAVSDYRFRGMSRTNNDFAIQGGIDFYSDSGLYVGAWASNVDGFNGADAETNLYVGYSGENEGMIYDFGVTGYLFPGGSNINHIETYGSVGLDFGLFTSSVGVAYMPEQSNLMDMDNIYVYNDTKIYVPDTPFSIDLHLGFEDGYFGNEKIDWKIGTSVTFEQFELGISYVDTNVTGLGKRADSGVIFSIAAFF
ncbi:TorF family putative porin [Pseudemcibacter aquimaris]|uniref:TorF family putative porin n=1 Tax=Pseudemcibacter aquimaris TaxID=2857064 RepID=UPI0020138B43|nr:TorF family putative porin [Pseudemcibacter aquimaris]MCC3862304.1 TorF family putative porin [Pseudemcibacter aquimaris]WDU59052.1 TorF family putative porin [Pseudemcibacter aquimaris]